MKILKPYEFSVVDNTTIKQHFKNHEDWDTTHFDDIRKNIRAHLRTQQDNKCCYCRRVLGFDIKEVDVEHIIPKATYTNFTFSPCNIALSCAGCNTIKGDKNILKKQIKRYPKNSKGITIVHAHYDDYDEHIRINSGLTFEALSTKGSNTITICELFRLKKVMKNAKEAVAKKSGFTELTSRILNATSDEMNEIIEAIGLKLQMKV